MGDAHARLMVLGADEGLREIMPCVAGEVWENAPAADRRCVPSAPLGWKGDGFTLGTLGGLN